MDKDNMSLLDRRETSELSSGSPPASLGRAPCQSNELSGIADYALLNGTYSINISDSGSKLKEHFTYLSSDTDLEMQKEERFFDVLKDQNKDSGVLEDVCRNVEGDYKDIIGTDIQKRDLDEDSQQEYHSAEEQDYSGYHLDFDQIKTLYTPDSEVVELGNSDYEIKCANGLGEDHVKKLEGSTFFSYESTHIRTQENTAEVSEIHDYLSLTEYCGQKSWRCQEHEAGIMNQSVFDGIVQMGGAAEEQDAAYSPEKPPKTPKANISPDKRTSQMTDKRGVCGEEGEENKLLMKSMENPSSFLERASPGSQQPSKCFQSSTTFIFDESYLSAYDQSCYQFIQSTTKPGLDFPMPMPKVSAKESHSIEENSPPKVTSGDVISKTHLTDVDCEYPKCLVDADHGCLVRVNQTVDASSDFRACFTTSRATSTRSSVASRSSNTEITMMRKTQRSEWPDEKLRSVACNTDLSCLQDWAEAEGLLRETFPKGPQKAFPVENSKANDTLLIKDHLELKNKFDVKDLKKNPKSSLFPSQFQLSKEAEKNFSSKCCQKTLQRAMEAELLLLKAHYQMCHQHCWKIYRLVMEEKESFTRNFAGDFAKTELGSTLLSLFGDLKLKYLSMREKIIKGVPLDELPPLSVESKLSSFFSTFIPSKLMKEDSLILSGPNSALRDVPGTHNADPGSTNLKRILSQTAPASENGHPKQDITPKNESRKTQDLNVGIRNLKLDDEDYTKWQDISEAWFDAKENLTGMDHSEILKNQTEQEKKKPEFSPEENIGEPSRREPNKGYLIHVSSLGPSVSEKYQVSEVSICTSSHNYRSENELAFGPLEKMMHGKSSSSVPAPAKLPDRVLRPPGPKQENVYLSQKSGKKGFKQNKPVKLLPETPLPYIPSNTLNLGSFTRLLKKLEGLHPDVGRDTIIDALQEVRTNNKGFLSGLSLTTIVEMTTSVLRNSAFKKGEKKHCEEISKIGIY